MPSCTGEMTTWLEIRCCPYPPATIACTIAASASDANPAASLTPRSASSAASWGGDIASGSPMKAPTIASTRCQRAFASSSMTEPSANAAASSSRCSTSCGAPSLPITYSMIGKSIRPSQIIARK